MAQLPAGWPDSFPSSVTAAHGFGASPPTGGTDSTDTHAGGASITAAAADSADPGLPGDPTGTHTLADVTKAIGAAAGDSGTLGLPSDAAAARAVLAKALTDMLASGDPGLPGDAAGTRTVADVSKGPAGAGGDAAAHGQQTSSPAATTDDPGLPGQPQTPGTDNSGSDTSATPGDAHAAVLAGGATGLVTDDALLNFTASAALGGFGGGSSYSSNGFAGDLWSDMPGWHGDADASALATFADAHASDASFFTYDWSWFDWDSMLHKSAGDWFVV